MNSKALVLPLENRRMVPTVLHSLGARALLKFEKISHNPIATSITLALMLLTIVTLAILSGCATVDTFNKKVAVGYSSITAARETTLTLLKANKISVDTARASQKTLDDARGLIDAARMVYKDNPKDAANNLNRALAIVTALQAFLATKETS